MFSRGRSNRSNPTSYSFYLIGLLWSGDLRETSKLQNTVSFGSPLSLPKMENIGCAQPALQCCTLHSLERDHTHLWSNIESKVQNELKTQGFFCTFWHKSVQFLSISQRNYHTLSAKLKKPVVFAYFPGARSNRSNPTSYSFYLIGLLWSADLRETSTAKHRLVWVSFVFAQNGKHWSCSTCLAMLHTAQFREGSYSFVVKHWVKSSKRVENAGFFAHFGTKVYNSCQFPREIIILYQQNSKNPLFLHIFQGLVQIEAIPHPIASIWLDCFEGETLEKHSNCKTLSRLGLLCLCQKWKTLVVLNLPCNAAHCTV